MPIPVTLITGFLGSGKSTLINRIMAEKPTTRFGLIVNEFGDVNLESQIVEAGKDEITELSNGCMCCVVRADLLSAVKGLLDRQPFIRHIILEASGLSDPVPIAATFLNDTLGGQLRFDSILCVVDTVNFFESAEDFLITAQQLEYSDFILLSKTDIAPAEQVVKVRKFIMALVPSARILVLDDSFSADLVLDSSILNHDSIVDLEIEEHSHEGMKESHPNPDPITQKHTDENSIQGHKGRVYHHVHESVDTFFYKSKRALDPERFGNFLRLLPRSVFRAKGFLYFPDSRAAGKKYILQLVGRRANLEAKPWGEEEERQSAMVFIGRGFDTQALEQSLRECELSA